MLILAGLALSACDAQTPAERAPASPGTTLGEREKAEATPVYEELASALRAPDVYGRVAGLAASIPRLGPESVPDVARILEDFRLTMGPAEFELLVRFWASHAPAEATSWVFKKASPRDKLSGTQTVIELWAAADPGAALLAVESALEEANVDVERIAERALVHGWFEADREGLVEYIYGLGSGIKRQRAVAAFLLALARADGSDAAIRWAESIPAEDRRYKLEVYRQLMATLAWSDMPAAKRFCAAHCDDGAYGKGLRTSLIRVWLRGGEDGGEIIRWVTEASEENERQRENKEHALWIAFATWAHYDHDAAIAWMEQTLEANPERPDWLRTLYGEYARQIARKTPDVAIRWAELIEDDAKRELTLVRIARYWRSLDEAAAEAWLEQSPLSEAARAQARDDRLPDYLPGASNR